MRPRIPLLTLLLALIPGSYARKEPTSFCKCICFQNSTIIPLNSPPPQPPPNRVQPTASSVPANKATLAAGRAFALRDVGGIDENTFLSNQDLLETREGEREGEVLVEREDAGDEPRRALTCSDCNRAFCLDYNLAICKDAREEDVFTSCFQRDSLKDETVVLSFLLLTTGLLGFALLKPFIQRYTGLGGEDGAQGARPFSYSALSGTSGSGGSSTARRGVLPISNSNYAEDDAVDSAAATAAPPGGRLRGGSSSSLTVARQGGLST